MAHKLKNHFTDYISNQSGATAIEYGLIAALIGIGMLAGITAMGGGTNGMWTRISNSVTNAL